MQPPKVRASSNNKESSGHSKNPKHSSTTDVKNPLQDLNERASSATEEKKASEGTGDSGDTTFEGKPPDAEGLKRDDKGRSPNNVSTPICGERFIVRE